MPATQKPVAEAQAQKPEPAIAEAREPEASPDTAVEKSVTPGTAPAKKLRIIKDPIVHEDPTLYFKTWTGNSE